MAKKKQKERTEVARIRKDTQAYGLEQMLAPDEADMEAVRKNSQYHYTEDELIDTIQSSDNWENGK